MPSIMVDARAAVAVAFRLKRVLLLCVASWCAVACSANGFVPASTGANTSSSCRHRLSDGGERNGGHRRTCTRNENEPGTGLWHGAPLLSIRGGSIDGKQQHQTTMNLFRPTARAGLQSASVMTVADIVTQLLVEKRTLFGGGTDEEIKTDDSQSSVAEYDPVRTLRWAIVGLTLHGPYFFNAFARLDRIFGAATSLLVVAKKTAFAQFVVFPPYLVALFTYVGILEGSDDVWGKVRDRVPKAFLSGCVFWPIANCINFAAVPSRMRVMYVASVGGLWNGYLSYLNAEKGD
mmetsp:Transcript_19375/g.41805  ORF Transcript_19375/g.41805 Transcript_19375/m.41805 type:complete len:291 (+) Transcript_19375:124-996(+)